MTNKNIEIMFSHCFVIKYCFCNEHCHNHDLIYPHLIYSKNNIYLYLYIIEVHSFVLHTKNKIILISIRFTKRTTNLNSIFLFNFNQLKRIHCILIQNRKYISGLNVYYPIILFEGTFLMLYFKSHPSPLQWFTPCAGKNWKNWWKIACWKKKCSATWILSSSITL